MPLISSFYGLLIYIYNETNSPHHLPHFHVKYAEFQAVFDFYGNCLESNMPHKQNKLVEAWALLHSEELAAAWTAWHENGEIIKIEGLR